MRFTKDHEYVRVERRRRDRRHQRPCAEQLGDVVFVELPEVGAKFAKGDERGGGRERQGGERRLRAGLAARSSRSTTTLDDAARADQRGREGRGWFFKLKLADPSELAALMDEAAYADFLKTLA